MGLATSAWKHSFRSDDNHRVHVAVSVIFGDGVRRIVQAYTIYQKPVGVLARHQINATDPSVTLSRAVVFSLDPIVE